MACELIISEKPSSAKKIAEALADGKALRKLEQGVPYYELTHKGQEIIVGSAVGHLFSVAEKEKSFTYPSFEVEWRPTFEIEKGALHAKKYSAVLKSLAKRATSVTVATDYDVEGETIGYNIVRFICKRDDAGRMKFSTVTRQDLVQAFERKSPSIDWGQAYAGTTRHVIDWLYGINLSRALTLAVKKAGSFKILSSGRVQGPALRILYDREKAIAAFVPVPYWQLRLLVEKEGSEIEAWHEKDRFASEEEARKVFDTCKEKDVFVDDIETAEFRQAPPHPFDLPTLQAEAYRCFGLAPKRTLEIAQSLYSAGFTSYPRTSSQQLPPEIGFARVLGLLQKQAPYGVLAGLLLARSSLRPNNGKKMDPAHPAIYPTGESPTGLRPEEQKVYDLIVKRFFATFCEAAVRETVTISFKVEGEVFKAKGSRTVERNWHEFYEPYVDLKEVEFPKVGKGEVLEQKLLEFLAKETKPPKRYTPASIIAELERKGLGTKATRADIVESLYKRGYVVEKSLEVTPIGMRTVETLSKYCPSILDEELTRRIEEEMEGIRERKVEPDQVVGDAVSALTQILGSFKEKELAIGESLADAQRTTVDNASQLSPCPKCGSGMIRIMVSRKFKRRFAACDRYPECDQTIPCHRQVRSNLWSNHARYVVVLGSCLLRRSAGRRCALILIA
ncbi:MAG: DNA topoisomerase I, partial [Nitrosarchaeum sp.]|nr:DNA topoisomerase I [Nitrosarchaeum sp.]